MPNFALKKYVPKLTEDYEKTPKETFNLKTHDNEICWPSTEYVSWRYKHDP